MMVTMGSRVSVSLTPYDRRRSMRKSVSTLAVVDGVFTEDHFGFLHVGDCSAQILAPAVDTTPGRTRH